MSDYLLEIMSEIVENYDTVDQIETKILLDLQEELYDVLHERHTNAPYWDDYDEE